MLRGAVFLLRYAVAAGVLLAASLHPLLHSSTPDDPRRKIDPEVESLNNLGVSHYESGRYQQAIEALSRAFRMDPESTDVRSNLTWAWIGLGLEFLSAGEPQRAADAFQESLELEVEGHAHFGLGYIAYLDRQDDSAREHLQNVLRLKPEFSRASKVLAMIEYRQGQAARAIELMAKAAELDPEDAEAAAILRRWRTEESVSKSFKSVRSEHFYLRYDPTITARVAQLMVHHLEGCHATIGELLGHWSSHPLRVGAFTEAGFQQATGAVHWVGGLFDGQVKVPVFEGSGEPGAQRSELFRALQHEFSHGVVLELYPGCPNWLNEGLAQYFEIFPVARSQTEDESEEAHATGLARRDRLRDEVFRRLREGRERRIHLEKIPAQLWEIGNEGQARWTYLQGLGFVIYLAERYGTFRLPILLTTARSEGSLQRGFLVTYGLSLGALEEAWWRAVLRQKKGGG